MHFILDVISPAEAIVDIMADNWLSLALAALLIIGAAIGIIVFNKKKNNNKGEDK